MLLAPHPGMVAGDFLAVRINNEVVTSLEITPEQIEHWIITVRESSDRVDQFMNMA